MTNASSAPLPAISAGAAVLAMVGVDRYVALVCRLDGTWVLPKGHLIEGESLAQGALREIEEETGLPPSDIVIDKYLGAYEFNEFDPGHHHLKINHFFLATYRKSLLPSLRTDHSHKAAEWHLLPLGDIQMCYAYQRKILAGLSC